MRAETFAGCIIALYAEVINYQKYIPAFNEQLFLYFLNITYQKTTDIFWKIKYKK